MGYQLVKASSGEVGVIDLATGTSTLPLAPHEWRGDDGEVNARFVEQEASWDCSWDTFDPNDPDNQVLHAWA